MIDIPRALRVATDTGEVRFGLREVRRAAKSKKAKLVVLASNCPAEATRNLGDIRVFRFGGTNVDLGAACGDREGRKEPPRVAGPDRPPSSDSKCERGLRPGLSLVTTSE